MASTTAKIIQTRHSVEAMNVRLEDLNVLLLTNVLKHRMSVIIMWTARINLTSKTASMDHVAAVNGYVLTLVGVSPSYISVTGIATAQTAVMR
jgi:hypothetical protein